MKYFIGTKFAGKNFTKQRSELEEIMSEIGVDNENTQTEMKNKIKKEICSNIFDLKEIVKKFVRHITLFLEDELQNIIGLLIFDIDYKESCIYIHYLCSMQKGGGKLLLDKIKEYSNIGDIDTIMLQPVPHKKLVQYYQENGFQIEGLDMIYYLKRGGKTVKKRRTTRTTRKISNGMLGRLRSLL